MGLSRGLLRYRSLSNIEMNNAIQTKGHAMKKVYIGIDAHKAESEAINNLRSK